MKKRIVMSTLCAVVVGTAGYVGYKSMPKDAGSDLLLANVEALAKGESDGRIENAQEHNFICGVPMDGISCTTHVISCPGGGTGCTPRKCPIHG